MASDLDQIVDKCASHKSSQKLDSLVAACDSWEETKHPRDNGGQFAAGAGGGGSGGSTSKTAGPPAAAKSPGARTPAAGKSKAPFVNDFMKEHKTREQDLSRLSSLSDEKLNKALALIEKHNVNDEDAKYMKGLIRETLKSGKPSAAPAAPPKAAGPASKTAPKADPTTEGFLRTTWQPP